MRLHNKFMVYFLGTCSEVASIVLNITCIRFLQINQGFSYIHCELNLRQVLFKKLELLTQFFVLQALVNYLLKGSIKLFQKPPQFVGSNNTGSTKLHMIGTYNMISNRILHLIWVPIGPIQLMTVIDMYTALNVSVPYHDIVL